MYCKNNSTRLVKIGALREVYSPIDAYIGFDFADYNNNEFYFYTKCKQNEI